MKRTVLIGTALIAVLFASTTAVAADYTLGLRFWANTWDETVSTQAGTSEKFNNGSALMAGPALNVRFLTNWFADATYLTTLGDYKSSDWLEPGDTMKFKRSDLDFAIGRTFRPPFLFRPDPDVNIGVYAAYKFIDAPASYTNTGAGLNNFDIGTWRLEGPGLGVRTDIPLTPSTRLYGDLSFFWLKQQFEFSIGGGSQPFSTSGMVFELGVKKTYTPALSADVGMKFMQFEGKESTGDTNRDTFFGLTAGIMYTS